ncbi:MAG: hypothetical protein ABFS32_11555 [Bacteroidota bacterium]
MQRLYSLIIILFLVLGAGCGLEDPLPGGSDMEDALSDGSKGYYSSSSSGSSSGSSSSPSGTGNDTGQEGLITAGEWNDLENWNFWTDLLDGQTYSDKPDYWRFYTRNRVSVKITDGTPVVNAKVELRKNGEPTWIARTDNNGIAELFPGLFAGSEEVDLSEFYVNNIRYRTALHLFKDGGVNEVMISSTMQNSNKVEISFIVDATGSMSDELEFLKDDLESVIQRAANDNQSADIYTSSVFYRDIGDDYLVKHSDFSQSIGVTKGYIAQQQAAGGGDYPEAVHTALKTGIEQLQWSDDARTRIAFLLLDAPPHYETQIVDEIHTYIKKAAEKGIKIIPITASGIDKETEFLMRFFSISTNGTYVFITNDSGIGNDHLEASVGEYEVEYLNDLMVRLINKYIE